MPDIKRHYTATNILNMVVLVHENKDTLGKKTNIYIATSIEIDQYRH